ncbi:MAG TPA: hypothetical protein VFN42_09295 [Acetobacteraceae bacterium]|nr:hypothetical protein [Acetobacteraceae bacterium]
MPERIADLLVFLRVLLAYGQHLTDSIEQRAASRGFGIIAQCFGTTRVAAILARVARGMLRAIALERVLLARAARGRDLAPYKRRRPQEPDTQPAGQPQEEGAAQGEAQGDEQAQGDAQAQEPPRPGRRPPPEPLPEFPTLEQLEAYTRRHPIGRAVAAICCDLGIASGLCEGWFTTVLYQAISWYRGNFPKYYKQIQARQAEFSEEWDRDTSARYDWPSQSGEVVHRFLGFLIGENVLKPGPVPMLAGLAAAAVTTIAATGPP